MDDTTQGGSLLNENTEAPVNAEPTQDFVVAEPERPAWLPEKYKSPEDLAKAYTELSSKLGQKEEDFKAKLKEEMFVDRPASSGDYQLPDVVDESAVDNELLKWWSETSFNNGYGQEKFQEGIEKFAEVLHSYFPNADAEIEKLGDNANARIEAVSLFANQFFQSDHMPAIERMAETADGIAAIEYMMSKMKAPSMNVSTQATDRISDERLRDMMKDERYWNPSKRDSDYINQVNSGFKKLYG